MATAAGSLPPLTIITDEQQRWVVIGICLNKLLTPVLRTVLAKEISTWYNYLCVPPQPINNQIYPKQAKQLPPSTINLHYGNINKNSVKSISAYDYNVKDAESLAKLFVQPFMAQFSGFDHTMDLSAALAIICEGNPFHTSGAAVEAKNVRSVRNEWAHCDFSYWSDARYHACMLHIESLVKKLNLSNADENDFVKALNNWKDKGNSPCPMLTKSIRMYNSTGLYDSIFMVASAE